VSCTSRSQISLKLNCDYSAVSARDEEMGLSPEGTVSNVERTVVIKGENEVATAIFEVVSRTHSKLNIATNSAGPSLVIGGGSYASFYPELRKRGVTARFITEITEKNLSFCKQMRKLGIKLRHLSGMRGNILINETEYLASIDVIEGRPLNQIIYSNMPQLIQHEEFLFETLWNDSLPARQRIEEIEHGIKPSSVRVMNDPEQIDALKITMAREGKREILILSPSERELKKDPKFLQILQDKASQNINVRILTPHSGDLTEFGHLYPSIQWRSSPESMVGFAIYDRRDILITQYLSGPTSGDRVILSAIHSSNEKTTPSVASIFEALWETSDLRQKEARMRRQSQLLQDILTHDLRNYNQVIKLSAELMREDLKDNILAQSLTENMIRAIDGSSSLLERAKGLGKIIAEDKPALSFFSLRELIDQAIRLVKDAEPNKEISVDIEMEDPKAKVLADDLINEVFLNVISNSIKYTEGEVVEIEIKVASPNPLTLPSGETRNYWLISISDKGKGIPDETKPRLFSRYIESAKGSGLGLSIVHALVVERYGGKVSVRDRIPGDSSKGTTVEIVLQASE
jgi:two-component system, OmpR family, sensor histidine kinase VicK